jgi:hypothetical protein
MMRPMRGSIFGLLVVCACKAQLADSLGGDDTPAIDAPIGTVDSPDGTVPLGPWGPAQRIPGASTAANEDDGTLSNDTLELIFAAEDPNDANRKHLYSVTRANAQTMTWVGPSRLSININGTTDQTPRLSEDAKTLYFASNRPGTTGNLDIWQSTRPAVGGTWGTPTLVPGVNSAQSEKTCVPCDNQRYLLISGRGGVSEDVYEGVLGAGPPVLVAELSTAQAETGTFVTKDCRTMFFASNRSGQNMMYTSTRSAPSGPWGAPLLVTDFASTGGAQEDPWMSPDGRTFVFSTIIGTTNKDVYISTR